MQGGRNSTTQKKYKNFLKETKISRKHDTEQQDHGTKNLEQWGDNNDNYWFPRFSMASKVSSFFKRISNLPHKVLRKYWII